MTNIPIEGINIANQMPHHEDPNNWKRYFSFSHDHKVIGIQYLVTSFIFFLVGGIFAMVIRGELITPDSDLVDRTVYNGMFTMHGTVMLFLWTFPSLVGCTTDKIAVKYLLLDLRVFYARWLRARVKVRAGRRISATNCQD
jgi:cytochrome c oxidase subunit I